RYYKRAAGWWLKRGRRWRPARNGYLNSCRLSGWDGNSGLAHNRRNPPPTCLREYLSLRFGGPPSPQRPYYPWRKREPWVFRLWAKLKTFSRLLFLPRRRK